MKKERHFQEPVLILTKEQRERFNACIPKKVYRTERNITMIVAMTQLLMIVLFLINTHISWEHPRTLAYFSLYIFLFTTTCITLILYRYTVKHEKYRAFVWLRRVYAFLLCFWVLGITFLEQMSGKGLAVYYYLIPTMAAVLLLAPLESVVIFGTTWVTLTVMLVIVGEQEGIFGNVVNTVFVTVLGIFISYRYYRSMAVEFYDRETIETQYEEIESANRLLKELVHVDRLTGLYNRHYLIEVVYEKFLTCKKQNFYGMLLMADIDYFKQYNDSYGHIQGDECLKAIGQAMNIFCGEHGFSPIRYGGEEFLLIKMEEQPFNPKALAEELERRVKDANVVRSDVAEGYVTISGGVWYDMLTNIEHIELAIKHADTAMYKAKSAGRNRIICR